MSKLEEIFNIEGKTVLITGSCGFFGKHISKAFLEAGAKVILLSRSKSLCSQVQKYSSEFGHKVHGSQVDFYNREHLTGVIMEITNGGDIDVVINNAYDMSETTGFNTVEGDIENLTYAHWKAAFDCSTYATFLITQIIGEAFKKKGKGSIINIGSMYSIVAPNPKLYEGKPFVNPATYSANKAAILALTRYIASFWGKHGIRCNAVLPGPISNTETKSANSVDPKDDFLQRLRDRTVLNRIGRPEDLMGILFYLASDASSYMTGQAISVDGGWTIT